MRRSTLTSFTCVLFAIALEPAASAEPLSAPSLTAPVKAKPVEPDPYMPYPAPNPKVLAPAERGYTYTEPQLYPSLAWIGTQLLPSPEVAFGRVHENGEARQDRAFGLRWQLTPALWSWGTNRRVSRWRYFVVDPLARHSGSIELSTNIEYFWGHVERFIVRPGVRAYFPLAQRGEYLSMSLGTSTYAYDDQLRVAYDVGAYVLWGMFGVQATVAPDHGPLSAIATLRVRYF